MTKNFKQSLLLTISMFALGAHRSSAQDTHDGAKEQGTKMSECKVGAYESGLAEFEVEYKKFFTSPKNAKARSQIGAADPEGVLANLAKFVKSNPKMSPNAWHSIEHQFATYSFDLIYDNPRVKKSLDTIIKVARDKQQGTKYDPSKRKLL